MRGIGCGAQGEPGVAQSADGEGFDRPSPALTCARREAHIDESPGPGAPGACAVLCVPRGEVISLAAVEKAGAVLKKVHAASAGRSGGGDIPCVDAPRAPQTTPQLSRALEEAQSDGAQDGGPSLQRGRGHSPVALSESFRLGWEPCFRSYPSLRAQGGGGGGFTGTPSAASAPSALLQLAVKLYGALHH